LKRGVKIRTISEWLISTNAEMEELISIENKAGSRIRYVSTPPPTLLLLFDEKEVLIITSATGTLESSALWSNNPGLIALSKCYFESLWQSATETNEPKRENDCKQTHQI
jgi:hypothetical protein